MDELEFRRRLLSDPAARDEDMSLELPLDPAKQQLQQDLLLLDQQIKASLSVPVPPDLADKLLLSQSLLQHKKIRQQRWWLGMAASVMLVAGLVQFRDQIYPWHHDLGGHALAHVYHEAEMLENENASVNLEQVNQLLSDFGGKLTTWPDTIRYARFCNFQGTRSLHLIFNTEQGPVTVFILPKNHGLPNTDDFSDPLFHGRSMQLEKADVVLVAGLQQTLAPMASRLYQQLQFQI
ncbi:MAG: DUF3379 family protein [Rheinheimera sp.]